MRSILAFLIVVIVLGGVGVLSTPLPDATVEYDELVISSVNMEPEPVVEPEPEPEWYPEEEYAYEEEWYEEPVYEEHHGSYDPYDFKSMGVVYDDSGNRFTWYSQNDLPGGGLTDLNESGRTVDERGFVVDGDGYIAVASPYGQDPIGTVVDTPYGPGKVYDSNEGDSYDIYTDY